MSQLKNFDERLTRRSWLVLAATAVTSGCGGGVSTAALPGTGGTGIYAQGAISGFGSVIINAVRFDDTKAAIQLDGHSASSADLRLGMVASVQGHLAADVTLGTASNIDVWSIAQGVVTQLRLGSSGEFVVSGMTVRVDSTTVLEGIANAAAIVPGMRVVAWGLQAGADGASWTATRVAVSSDTAIVSTGVVSLAEKQFLLNGFILQGSAVASLVAGELIRAQGNVSNSGGVLDVASIYVLNAVSASPSGVGIEIEGMVTAVLPNGRFMLGNNEVDATGASYIPATAQVTLGARLEVEGAWQAGLLVATKVEVGEEKALLAVEISARIDQFTSVADFVVRGQRCDASGVTIVGNGTLADLKVGTPVKLIGTKAGDVLKVTSLEIR
jgi:hypothetical protein